MAYLFGVCLTKFKAIVCKAQEKPLIRGVMMYYFFAFTAGYASGGVNEGRGLLTLFCRSSWISTLTAVRFNTALDGFSLLVAIRIPLLVSGIGYKTIANNS